MLNSRLGLFAATYFRRFPFSLSYGVILPSSLTTLLPLALEFSSRLPVSVCGTDVLYIPHTFSRPIFPLLPYSDFSPVLTPGATIARVRLFLGVSMLKYFDGYGISTVCASATPLGLALASGLPWADEPAPRILRLSAITILTQFSLLIPAFSLLYCPHLLPLMLHPVHNAPLPSILLHCLRFGYMLSPVESSAQRHSTSELLRTLLMSGCF